MSKPTSFDVFKRTVGERYQQFKTSLDGMLLAFGSTSAETRQAASRQLTEAGQKLAEVLTDSDKPNWLTPLLTASIRFLKSADEERANALLKEITAHYSSIKPISLSSESEETSRYDFDQMYENLRTELKIEELFDSHIRAIQRLVESGEIESVTALEALRQLLEVLSANRRGSYVATRQSIVFARFVQNAILISLKKLPILGTLVEAAEQTLNQLNEGFDEVEQELPKRSIAAIKESLPRIERVSFIVDEQMLALPSPSIDDNLVNRTAKLTHPGL